MRKFLQKLIEGLRMFFVILLEDDEEKEGQTQISSRDQRRDIAKPLELGISSSEKPQYKKSKSVLTYRERILLRTIRRAVAGDYTILMKVRLGDFVWLANEPQDRKFHSNQVQCKHVDFLLCDKVMIEPLLVIELDDSSHKNYDHAERDNFKDDTFDAIGLPFIRMQVQENYDEGVLKRQIQEKMGVGVRQGI